MKRNKKNPQLMERYRALQIHAALRLLMSIPEIELLCKTTGGRIFIQVMFENKNYTEAARANKLSGERCRQLFRHTLNKIHKVIRDKHEQLLRMDATIKEYKYEIHVNEKVPHHILQLSLSELKLSPRTRNTLNAGKILTIEELLAKPPQELMKYFNFGKNSMIQLSQELKKWNITYFHPDYPLGKSTPEKNLEIIRKKK